MMISATTPIYHEYAPIYDAIGQGRFGARMAAWALGWLNERGATPQRVLDLACGTGAASLVFAAAGCEVVGVDRSAAMLAIAGGKARDSHLAVTFVQTDIRDLFGVADRLPDEARVFEHSSFDLVTCFYDSLNYLLGDGDLAWVLRGAARALRPGGHLIFDLNTAAEHTTWDERDVVTYDGRDCLVYNRLSYDQRTRLARGRIVWFVREIDRWWRGEETHVERSWSDAEVCAALAEAGLELLARLTPQGEIARAEAPRVVYITHHPALQSGKEESQRGAALAETPHPQSGKGGSQRGATPS